MGEVASHLSFWWRVEQPWGLLMIVKATHFSYHRFPHYHHPVISQSKQQISFHMKPAHLWTEAPQMTELFQAVALLAPVSGMKTYSTPPL